MLTAGLLFVSIVTPHAAKVFDRQPCCYAPLTPTVSFEQAAQAHQGGSFFFQLDKKNQMSPASEFEESKNIVNVACRLQMHNFSKLPGAEAQALMQVAAAS